MTLQPNLSVKSCVSLCAKNNVNLDYFNMTERLRESIKTSSTTANEKQNSQCCLIVRKKNSFNISKWSHMTLDIAKYNF